MSKNRRDINYIIDIREAIDNIGEYAKGLDYDDFIKDKKTRDAVVHNIEIIGEATKNLSDFLRERYSQIPWKSMAGVRDRLAHGYFDVNYEIVWNIIEQELPKLLTHINEILTQETEL